MDVIFKKIVEVENIVRECFVVGNKTVKHSKSYSNGGFVKEWLAAAVIFCVQIMNDMTWINFLFLFVQLQAFRGTFCRVKIVRDRASKFEAACLVTDESTNISHTAQLDVLVRWVDAEFDVTEQILCIQPAKDRDSYWKGYLSRNKTRNVKISCLIWRNSWDFYRWITCNRWKQYWLSYKKNVKLWIYERILCFQCINRQKNICGKSTLYLRLLFALMLQNQEPTSLRSIPIHPPSTPLSS